MRTKRSDRGPRAFLAPITAGLAAATILAVAVLGAAPAHALPDLRITAMSVQGTPLQGQCNTVNMTVRNDGDQFTNVAGIKIFLATYTQGASNQNRAEKNDILIGPIQPGQQTSFQVTNVDFKAQGAMSVQALVDFDDQVAESNEGNNTSLINTSVSGVCGGAPPAPTGGLCDLTAVFTAPAPTQTSVNGPTVQFALYFKNIGKEGCARNKVKLMRYNNNTCSGYGSQVGGSGNFQTLNALAPQASQSLSFADIKTTKGKYCYKIVYSSPHNDIDNSNHHPKKVLAVN
ncbi:MAG TPA: CARDB domain-containing protein [Thermoanaerobaculia bacterium]|nr:CARDB domain-containing protein [Thermoanaerobaculia bacterium]